MRGSQLELVDTEAGFAEVIDALRGEPLYALDTEFHRERTYFPKLALLQLAWSDGGLALVDPTKVDLAPLTEILQGPGVAVLHASDQDLEVLDLACGTGPAQLFDTQVAAGFVGLGSPSLSALYERTLGIQVLKAERLTDWLARPLRPEQLDYAASDVDRLIDVHDHLCRALSERGRLQWALDECEHMRAKRRGGRDPEEAWRRIKEARQLKGRALAVARSVAAWRERRAAELDIPSRYVISDLAVVGIAQRPPTTVEQLTKVRGADKGLGAGQAELLLEAVKAATSQPVARDQATSVKEVDRHLRPAVTLVSAWVSQLAKDLDLDTALLATRADIEALLRGDPDARLSRGWRAEMVGEPIRQVVAGEAALAFDGKGALSLERRSGEPLT